MQLLERYLQSVRALLPRRAQDDIVRELSENLVSQMEDRQEELGRPLTEEEEADILRRHGHPMLVAGRYHTHQHLIGPVFFPMYLLTLKIGLGAALIVTAILAAVSAIVDADPARRAVQELLGFPGRGLTVFAWTSLCFAALDRALPWVKAPKWDPRTLPMLARREDRLSRSRALCELIFSSAAAIWLLLVPQFPVLLLGPASAFLETTAAARLIYLPLLLLTLATAALAFVNVLRPHWTVARSAVRLTIQGGTCLLFAAALRSGGWVAAKAGATLPGGAPLDRVVDLVNAGCAIGLFVACFFAVTEIIREVQRLRAHQRPTESSGPTTGVGGFQRSR